MLEKESSKIAHHLPTPGHGKREANWMHEYSW